MTASKIHKLPDYLMPYTDSGAESTGNPPSGKGRYLIHAGHPWDDCWELADDLNIEVDTTPEDAVTVTCLNLQEYGIGDSLESAITDLLTSLSDYYQSLESREANLAPSARKDLEILRRLVHATTGNPRGR